jgi:hypothetical protein
LHFASSAVCQPQHLWRGASPLPGLYAANTRWQWRKRPSAPA